MESLEYCDFTFYLGHFDHFESLTVIINSDKVMRQRGTI